MNSDDFIGFDENGEAMYRLSRYENAIAIGIIVICTVLLAGLYWWAKS